MTGGGYASADTRSASSGSARISDAVIASTRGRSRSAMRGVNALLTRARSLVRSGESSYRTDAAG
ncbi:hypothetical protein [[Actinomadura] parvosata]